MQVVFHKVDSQTQWKNFLSFSEIVTLKIGGSLIYNFFLAHSLRHQRKSRKRYGMVSLTLLSTTPILKHSISVLMFGSVLMKNNKIGGDVWKSSGCTDIVHGNSPGCINDYVANSASGNVWVLKTFLRSPHIHQQTYKEGGRCIDNVEGNSVDTPKLAYLKWLSVISLVDAA